METVQISYAELADLDALAPLFDAYRMFYAQVSDCGSAHAYLAERIRLSESAILLARRAEQCVGFVQLYPGFSSIDMRRQWTLEDLFVVEAARRSGVARALMNAAHRHAEQGAVRLILSTAKTNRKAQALYESLGYVRDDDFLVYSLELG